MDKIKSMTGFGREEYSDEECKLTIEMKSVNHRYLDINVKLPKKLNFFELKVRGLLKKYIERGKVDIFITYKSLKETETGLRYNAALAKEYADYHKRMAEELSVLYDISASDIGRCPEVFTLQEESGDEEELLGVLTAAFDAAARRFVNSREAEGENLKTDLLEKLEIMKEYVAFIEERSPLIIAEYRNRTEERVSELLENVPIDENRIAMEVTLFSDKVCVDEEIVRLGSHMDAMKECLIRGGAVGRKLDFIAQEMNREANTILSKSGDLAITDTGIELKTMIEKIREQIQNIE